MNFYDKVTHIDKYAAKLLNLHYDSGFINYGGLIRKLDIESKKKEVLLIIYKNFQNTLDKGFSNEDNNYSLLINLLYNIIKELVNKQNTK